MGGVVVAGLVVGALAASLAQQEEPPVGRDVLLPRTPELVGVPAAEAGCSPIESPPLQRTEIIQLKQKHPPYSSTPPTSGPHFFQGSPGGIISWGENVPQLEELVANLAQGDIVVWHTGFDTQDERDALTGLFVSLKSDEILGVPGDQLGLQERITLTAWGKVQRCEKLSGEAVANFFSEFRGLGPGV